MVSDILTRSDSSDVLTDDEFNHLLSWLATERLLDDGFGLVLTDQDIVAEYLEAAGLPVKPCGLNADWSSCAWHLAIGRTNITDGGLYLLDDEEGNTYSIVKRNFGEDGSSTDIVRSLPIRDCLAAYLALPAATFDGAAMTDTELDADAAQRQLVRMAGMLLAETIKDNLREWLAVPHQHAADMLARLHDARNTINSFSELHDICDANCLGASEQLFELGQDLDAFDVTTDIMNIAQDMVDEWIKKGGLKSA